MPIRVRIEDNKYTVIGFICADNKEGGFREEVEKDILGSIGDHLFNIFRAFDDLVKLYKPFIIN